MSQHIHILVEGDTEEAFVRRVLIPHFEVMNIRLNPIIVQTRREASRRAFRGGYVPYSRLREQLIRLLGDTSASAVTMLFDYYRFPTDFPGSKNNTGSNGAQRVIQLEAAIAADLINDRFIPYLQLHEYEAFLFVSPSSTAEILGCPEKVLQITRVRQEFPSPEEINDSPATAPSKRIAAIYDAYDKVYHGPLVANRIGLPLLRQACPHFNDWLAKLERWNDEQINHA